MPAIPKLSVILTELCACPEAIEWSKDYDYKPLKTAWQECPNGSWMMWLLGMIELDRKTIVDITCKQVRLTIPKTKKDDPLLKTIEQWCKKKATIEEVKTAKEIHLIKTNYTFNAAWHAAACVTVSHNYNVAYEAASAAIEVSKNNESEMLKKCADMVRAEVTYAEAKKLFTKTITKTITNNN